MLGNLQKLARRICWVSALNLRRVPVRILLRCHLQLVFKKTRLPKYTVGDPRVDQSTMKKSLGFLHEARPPTIPWGSVGNRLEEMDLSTSHWRTKPSVDLQEDPSPLLGDPRVDHHRRLVTAHQVWQGPYTGQSALKMISLRVNQSSNAF
jgi:hypothetical protein